MNFPCPNKVDCPGTDLPISNYSAEGPDSPFWIGFSGGWWPGNKPRVGTPWKNPDGFVYCLSTQGQADANLCANNGFPEQWGSNGISGDPTRPGDGGSGGIPTYGSDEQRCIYTCPDGTQFVWTVAAGYARATNRAQADAIANSLACRLAIAHKICLSNLDNKGGCAGSGYFGTVKASIGVLAKLPLTWSIVSGNLPPGVDLDPDTSGDPNLSKTVGLIGTVDPSASGDYTFTLRATDADGNYLQKTFTITVSSIANCPSDGLQTVDYSFQMQLNGGTAPLVWSISSGSLPDGLSMDANGLITGTPTTIATSAFTVTVTDANKLACSKDCSMNVASAGTALGSFCADTVTTIDLQFRDKNLEPWTATIVAGALPTGMNVFVQNIGGVFGHIFIQGTPTSTGVAVFTLRATDKNGVHDDTIYNMRVIRVTVPSFCTNNGSTINYQITMAGGVGTPTFTITAGSLPTGVNMTLAGLLTGAPTTGGTYNFTVTGTDGAGNSCSQGVTIYAGKCSTLLPAAVSDTFDLITDGSTATHTFHNTTGETVTFWMWVVWSGTTAVGDAVEAHGIANPPLNIIFVNHQNDGITFTNVMASGSFDLTAGDTKDLFCNIVFQVALGGSHVFGTVYISCCPP